MPSAAVAAYKSLAHVERAFRSMKTVDLHVRPVFHYSEQRVRAHVFLCMLAYYVEWHMRERLKPMLFDDEYLDEASASRASPVAKAVRSEHAKAKDASKHADDGLPSAQLQHPAARTSPRWPTTSPAPRSIQTPRSSSLPGPRRFRQRPSSCSA